MDSQLTKRDGLRLILPEQEGFPAVFVEKGRKDLGVCGLPLSFVETFTYPHSMSVWCSRREVD